MRKAFIILTGIIFTLLTATCKQFTADIDDYLGYWAAEAYITDSSIKAVVQNDVNSIASVPSAEDVPITFTLQNPKSFPLDLPPEADAEKNVIVFEHLPKAPVAGRDYTLTQSEDRQSLLLTYKASFLQAHEWGEQYLSSVLTLYATDGRQFKQRYTFTVKANTPPPKPSFTVVKTKGSPAYYVLCIMAPGMDKKVPGGLLHKDLARVEINETSYSFSVNEAQTAFTKPEGDVFITRSEVEKLTEPGADDVPAGGWALYYKTDVEVKDGAVKKEYTVRLADAQGLVSDILNASTKPNKAEAEQVRITKGTVSGSGSGDADNPVIIGTDSSGAELSVSSATANTTVHCTLTDTGSAASRQYNGNPVTVPLPLNDAGEKTYKLEYYTDGEGFAATAVKTVYYRVMEGHTVIFDANRGTYPDSSTTVSKAALHGTIVSEPNPLPTREGYGLTGWYTDAACSSGQEWNFASDTVNGNITLYAQWTAGAVSYKVEHYKEKLDETYPDTADETEIKPGTTGQIAVYNQKTYEGFTYQSSLTEINGTQQLSGFIAGNNSTVVKLYYNRKQIRVTFKLDGGKIDGNSSDVTRRGKYGVTFTAPADPVKMGYTFSNWSPALPSPLEFPANDTTYTAQWTAAGNTPYRVEHYQESAISGGTYDLAHTDNLSGTTGTTATVTLKPYPGFEPGTYTPETIAPGGNTVVRVYYNRKQITVTFKPNGGKIDGNPSDVTRSGKYGAALTKPNDPIQDGYTFSNWQPTPPAPSLPSTFPAEDATYTAQWTPNTYTVTFSVDGGTGGSLTANYGSNPSTTASSTVQVTHRDSVTFTAHPDPGWEVDSWTGATANTPNTTATLSGVTAATIVTVTFKKTYTVTFKVDGGHGSLKGEYNGSDKTVAGGGEETFTVLDGRSVTFTAQPDRGYEVDSWTGATANTPNTTATLAVTANTTVTVKFKPGTLEFENGDKPGAWARLIGEVSRADGAGTIIIDGVVKAGNTLGDFGEITPGRNLTIKGKNASAVLDAAGKSRIFHLKGGSGNGKTLILEDITLKNGFLPSGASKEGGGVLIKNYNMLIMKNAHIIDCTAGSNGGGVCVHGIFKMQGSSTITGCQTTGGQGGGVFGSVEMQGGALVTPASDKNDVFLTFADKIKVTGALTHSPAARITPNSYYEDKVVVAGASAEEANFTVTPNGGETWRCEKVDNELKLKKD